MATEILLLLVRLNLVASGAILVVMALRPFARRWFGASHAYRLWFTVPIALVAALMPPVETWGPIGSVEHLANGAGAWISKESHLAALTTAWAAGALATAILTAWRYGRFIAQERSGRAGPAIVGVLTPRLVTPADFEARFTSEERRLVRAHERAHMDRLDARCNALVLGFQCLNWFNPLVHLAARAMRFDQELACDATVIHRLPMDRRSYAEALLRSHSDGGPSAGMQLVGRRSAAVDDPPDHSLGPPPGRCALRARRRPAGRALDGCVRRRLGRPAALSHRRTRHGPGGGPQPRHAGTATGGLAGAETSLTDPRGPSPRSSPASGRR